MLRGIDLSHWQGTVDWSAIAGDTDVEGNAVTFALVKSTEGHDLVDAQFAANWAGAAAAGLVRGAYHLARPSNNEADAEAQAFLSALDKAGGLEVGDLVAIDMEDAGVAAHESLLAWATSWLETVTDAVGVRPFLYGDDTYLPDHGLTGNDVLTRYPLWLAAWESKTFGTLPDVPANWDAITIHQYDNGGTVAGITGAVDLDCFTGASVEALHAFGKLDVPATYTVMDGDTWDSVAAKLGVSVADLKSANPEIDELSVGLVLTVPVLPA